VTRLPLLASLLAGCGDPETIVEDVRIPVALLDARGGRCEANAFEETVSASVELIQPLGPDPENPLGYCVLEGDCVQVPARSLGDRDALQQALRDQGPFFEGLPPYNDVLLFVRGTQYDDCQFSPAEDPLFCGASAIVNIADAQASFTVAVSCQIDSACLLAPPCAGSD